MYDPDSLEEEEPKPSRRASYKRRQEYNDDRHDQKSHGFQDRPESPFRDFAPPRSQRTHETSMLRLFFEFFIPPVDDDPENMRRHRIALSLAVIALSSSTIAAFGLFPGFSGFAYATTVTEIKVDLLEQRIFDNRIRQCTAATPEGRQFYGQKVRELMLKYQAATHETYPLPSCDEIR